MRRHRKEAGFTVVELMIATVVFTSILLVITTAVLRFSAAYYRSVRTTATQETARSIADTVSRALELGSDNYEDYGQAFAAPPGMAGASVRYFCAGGKVFAYQAGASYEQGSSIGLAMSDNNSGACRFDTAAAWESLPNRRQLLPTGMRLASFEIGQMPSGLKSISIVTASADLDLLCESSGSACTPIGSDDGVVSAGSRLTCAATEGSEYCAVSKINTVVGRRLR